MRYSVQEAGALLHARVLHAQLREEVNQLTSPLASSKSAKHSDQLIQEQRVIVRGEPQLDVKHVTIRTTVSTTMRHPCRMIPNVMLAVPRVEGNISEVDLLSVDERLVGRSAVGIATILEPTIEVAVGENIPRCLDVVKCTLKQPRA